MISIPNISACSLHVYFQLGLKNEMFTFKMKSRSSDRNEQKLLFPQAE